LVLCCFLFGFLFFFVFFGFFFFFFFSLFLGFSVFLFFFGVASIPMTIILLSSLPVDVSSFFFPYA